MVLFRDIVLTIILYFSQLHLEIIAIRPHKIDSMFYLSLHEHFPQILEKLHKPKNQLFLFSKFVLFFLRACIALPKIPEVKHRIYFKRPNKDLVQILVVLEFPFLLQRWAKPGNIPVISRYNKEQYLVE